MKANTCQLLDLDSGSVNEERYILPNLIARKRKQNHKNACLRTRQCYGESNLSREVPDSVFKESIGLT